MILWNNWVNVFNNPDKMHQVKFKTQRLISLYNEIANSITIQIYIQVISFKCEFNFKLIIYL